MKYLLDTCIVIAVLRGHPQVIDALRLIPASEIGISSITVMELEVGLQLATQRQKEKRRQLDRFLSVYQLLPFSTSDATETASIIAYLKQAGTPIGAYDVQLAGVALQRGLNLLTHNLKEFRRVPDLEVTDVG